MPRTRRPAGLTPGCSASRSGRDAALDLERGGRAEIALALHAGAGRVTSLHYGTFDYSASLGVSAAYQSLAHPAADYAKEVMQAAVAGNRSAPVGWLHQRPPGGSSRPSLRRVAAAPLAGPAQPRNEAYYQGWDMHFGHLPTRFVASFAFYREGFARATERLSDYLSKSGSGVLDEPATARALARYLHRGYSCGALGAAELQAAIPLPQTSWRSCPDPSPDTDNIGRPDTKE